MNFDLDGLKSSLKEAVLINEARVLAKPSVRKEIKRLEKELKLAKKTYNKLLIDIRASNKRIRRIKGYVSAYPRNLRNWTEKNIGNLISKIEFTQHFCKGEVSK